MNTINFILDNLTIIANILGAAAAYLLANRKVKVGRVVALFGVSCWLVYGIYNKHWDFVIADIIIITIYVQAILKFRQKQRLYKRMLRDRTEEQYDQEQHIEELQASVLNLEQKIKKHQKVLDRYHRMKKRKRNGNTSRRT